MILNRKQGLELLDKILNKPKTVTISIEEYNDLLDDAEFLNALRMAGVDNWDGYDEAINIYQSVRGE